MAMISRFEDIEGWQEARKLVKMLYGLTSTSVFQKTLVFEIRSNVLQSQQ